MAHKISSALTNTLSQTIQLNLFTEIDIAASVLMEKISWKATYRKLVRSVGGQGYPHVTDVVVVVESGNERSQMSYFPRDVTKHKLIGRKCVTFLASGQSPSAALVKITGTLTSNKSTAFKAIQNIIVLLQSLLGRESCVSVVTRNSFYTKGSLKFSTYSFILSLDIKSVSNNVVGF